MNDKSVPLLKIDTDKSIYFDLSKSELFIQEFDGPFTEKARGSYSKSSTWSISMVGGLLIIPLLAKQFKFVSFMPIYLTVLCLFGVGWIIGKLLANQFVEKSRGKRIKKNFKKEEVMKVLRNSSNLKLLVWVQFIFLLGYGMFFLYSLSINRLSTENTILLLLVSFVTSLMHYSVHPFAQQKAFRILKKQMKSGKYDES